MSWIAPVILPEKKEKLPKPGCYGAVYPVIVRGRRYDSVRKASAALGITWRRIYQLLKSGEAQRV
jgi:hypothetical protein